MNYSIINTKIVLDFDLKRLTENSDHQQQNWITPRGVVWFVHYMLVHESTIGSLFAPPQVNAAAPLHH